MTSVNLLITAKMALATQKKSVLTALEPLAEVALKDTAFVASVSSETLSHSLVAKQSSLPGVDAAKPRRDQASIWSLVSNPHLVAKPPDREASLWFLGTKPWRRVCCKASLRGLTTKPGRSFIVNPCRIAANQLLSSRSPLKTDLIAVHLWCGGSSAENNTFLEMTATSTPPSVCKYKICPSSNNICRMRYDLMVSKIALFSWKQKMTKLWGSF